MSAGDFEGHESLIAQLRAGTLDAPDHVHRRVLALGQGKRARVPMSRRRKLFILVPVAATLAVTAAVIHGAFSSGANPNASAAAVEFRHGRNQPVAGAAGATGARGPTGAQGPTGTAGPSGPNGGTGATGPTGTVYDANQQSPAGAQGALEPLHRSADTAKRTLSSTPESLLIPTHRLVHAVASLEVAVPSHGALTRATNKATEIVTQLGGYAQTSQYDASRSGPGNAFLDLRVPIGKAESAIRMLGGLGRLLFQSVTTKDLQQTATQQTTLVGQLQRAITIYEQALQSGTLSGSQRVEVQIRLAEAQHQLTATRKAHGRTLASGRTAEIQLRLTSRNHHAVVATPHARGRLSRLLHNAAGFLGLEAVIVLYALIVAIPIVLLIAIVWWLMRERRRREEKLLASA
ncbi:MAG TPA: DUF4349 domain-containing protein [Gaiellaceae bacterium]|nr:DUF4349 domain-containing protein [Gaiellaceae bacterium]